MMKNIHGVQLHSFQSYSKAHYDISIKVQGHHGTDDDYNKYGVQSEFCLIMPVERARELAATILELCNNAESDAQAETDAFRAQGGIGR